MTHTKDASCTTIDCVVCVCSKRDLNAWRKSAEYIALNIPSRDKVVIVPDGEIADFREANSTQFRVTGESEYVPGLKAHIESRMPEHMRWRAGWYLQQFIKLAAVKCAASNELGFTT